VVCCRAVHFQQVAAVVVQPLADGNDNLLLEINAWTAPLDICGIVKSLEQANQENQAVGRGRRRLHRLDHVCKPCLGGLVELVAEDPPVLDGGSERFNLDLGSGAHSSLDLVGLQSLPQRWRAEDVLDKRVEPVPHEG
jgi:hypothetical protein